MTDLKTRTDELRRQAWLRAQSTQKPTPAQILVNRLKALHDKTNPHS